jgi:demethylmenaquinone methyltransferase/2-methoxy-6-polyprenyl-1,4-benzoquinol methylase
MMRHATMDAHVRPPSLARAFDSAEAKSAYVRRLFATIAARYDLATRLLSFGADQRWKRRLMTLAGIRPGTRVLDLACGTGDLTLAAAAAGGAAIGLDVTPGMIHRARDRAAGAMATWVVADMCALALRPGSCDVVTTGYGLRNVPDLARAIAEVHTVLADGGTFCSLDFDRPAFTPLRVVYLGYLTVIGALLGVLLHGDSATYRYIPASIRRYPGARRVAAMLGEAGFRDVRHLPVLGGLMAIHVARK